MSSTATGILSLLGRSNSPPDVGPEDYASAQCAAASHLKSRRTWYSGKSTCFDIRPTTALERPEGTCVSSCMASTLYLINSSVIDRFIRRKITYEGTVLTFTTKMNPPLHRILAEQKSQPTHTFQTSLTQRRGLSSVHCTCLFGEQST